MNRWMPMLLAVALGACAGAVGETDEPSTVALRRGVPDGGAPTRRLEDEPPVPLKPEADPELRNLSPAR
jgi:hypothetical protein